MPPDPPSQDNPEMMAVEKQLIMELCAEAHKMSTLRHANLIQFLGVVRWAPGDMHGMSPTPHPKAPPKHPPPPPHYPLLLPPPPFPGPLATTPSGACHGARGRGVRVLGTQ